MKKPILIITIITSTLLLVALTSWLYIYNPKNLLGNMGFKPNPKILFSQTNFIENLEQTQKYENLLNEIEARHTDVKLHHDKSDVWTNGSSRVSADEAIKSLVISKERDLINKDRELDGWDCNIEVKVKNEGKTGLILVRGKYDESIKEESIIIKKDEYTTLNFIFAKTHKGGRPSVEIKSLE